MLLSYLQIPLMSYSRSLFRKNLGQSICQGTLLQVDRIGIDEFKPTWVYLKKYPVLNPFYSLCEFFPPLCIAGPELVFV